MTKVCHSFNGSYHRNGNKFQNDQFIFTITLRPDNLVTDKKPKYYLLFRDKKLGKKNTYFSSMYPLKGFPSNVFAMEKDKVRYFLKVEENAVHVREYGTEIESFGSC